MQLFDQNPNDNRFSGQRLLLRHRRYWGIDRFTSFFLQIEGLPFADQLSYKPRLAYTDAVNGALIANDHFVYGMAGISLKSDQRGGGGNTKVCRPFVGWRAGGTSPREGAGGRRSPGGPDPRPWWFRSSRRSRPCRSVAP